MKNPPTKTAINGILLMTQFTDQDQQYMTLALSLAKLGLYTTSPNPRVGCVLVKNGEIIGQGYHIKAGTAHAEVHALAQAGDNAKGATVYVTLEPCSHYGRTPPCAQALINAQVDQVVIAMIDPNPAVAGKGVAMLEQAGIAVQVGLLEQQARAINVGFIKLMTTGLPFVRCKLACSLDGKTAMANGESQWITSIDARRDVQRLRAQSCAIISGAQTVIQDDAKLTVRRNELVNAEHYYPAAYFPAQTVRPPIRVIIDSQHRLTPTLALFATDSPIIIVSTALDNQFTWPQFVEQLVVPADSKTGKVNLLALLTVLGERGINDILLESGAQLAGAFFTQNLVDQLVLYQAPILLGADAMSLVTLPELTQLTQAKQLTFDDVSQVGPDIRIIASLSNPLTTQA